MSPKLKQILKDTAKDFSAGMVAMGVGSWEALKTGGRKTRSAAISGRLAFKAWLEKQEAARQFAKAERAKRLEEAQAAKEAARLEAEALAAEEAAKREAEAQTEIYGPAPVEDPNVTTLQGDRAESEEPETVPSVISTDHEENVSEAKVEGQSETSIAANDLPEDISPETVDDQEATEKSFLPAWAQLKKIKTAAARERRIRRRWHLVSVPCSLGIMFLMAALFANLHFAKTVLPKNEVDLWTINRPINLTFLDRNGNEIGQRGILYEDPVPLDQLPPYLIDAFLATEDRRFFQHTGFDPRGLSRAVVSNLKAGTVVEGGSTITQQLAKNLFLGSEQTLSRKLEELQFSFWLEARLDKDDILSLYLNRIYLGAGTYGVEAAAQAYFSKSARDLTLPEAALIAGLPKAPSKLSPTTNPEGAQLRAQEVIDNLLETDLIAPEEAEAAKLETASFKFAHRDGGNGYFLDYVAGRVEERFGHLHKDMVIQTTFDPRLQELAEEAVRNRINEKSFARGAEEAAIVVFDQSGGIAALVGGMDYEKSQFNRATQARRQPGSAFKPFVYLAAMEAGMSPSSVVVDRPIKVGKWEPTNYNERHIGPMRMSTAAALSTNSVAVQIAEGIGRDRVIDAARRAGITTELTDLPSMALGSIEISLVELAAAYLPFAYSGAERPAHGVKEIHTRQGDLLYKYEPIEGYSVIDPAKAHDTLRLLVDVMERGTGMKGRFGGHQLAGKTGTTNDWRDAWFIGFSHYYTAGVWVGNDTYDRMGKISGSTIPLQIWRDFMSKAHEGLTPRDLLDDDTSPPPRNIREVAGVYATLRSDLYAIAYPAPQIDWQVIEGTQVRGTTSSRDIFGSGARVVAEPIAGNPNARAVVGSAAPGVRVERQNN